MLTFTLPAQKNKTDVLSFYGEFETNNETCIGYNNLKDFDAWLAHMTNRHTGKNLPKGFVRENFYLCYDKAEADTSAMPYVRQKETAELQAIY